MNKKNFFLIVLIISFIYHELHTIAYNNSIKVGAAQTNLYLPLLKNKRVGILTNHTACVDGTHLITILKKNKVNIKKIFTPEHGFCGVGAAGQQQDDSFYSIDNQKIPVASLYGKKLKPTAQDLTDIDMLIFDIQDVGARFYTYLSSLQYFMEAAAEYNKPLIILDRPNPNGFYVDGPVAEKKHYSFVGLQAIPIVHGMTIGEYARMLNSERWLTNGKLCNLMVIPCKNYTHKDYYKLPIPPSPNLKTMAAVYNYPSLCLFEGTPISIGRGTNKPFEVFGHPLFKTKFSFTPHADSPTEEQFLILNNQTCYGFNLKKPIKPKKQINLIYIKQAYAQYPDKNKFFTPFFTKLAGTEDLAHQISNNSPEEEIRKSWEPELSNFKKIRKKYLLYEDFE